MDQRFETTVLLAQSDPSSLTLPATAPIATSEPGMLEVVLQSDPILQLTLLILVAFSVISWAIILYKFRFLQQAAAESNRFLEAFWRSDRLDEAYRSVENYPHAPVAQVFRAGFAELRRLIQDKPGAEKQDADSSRGAPGAVGPSGLDNVTRALRRAGTAQMTALERRLPFLATCGSTAPFIGLFGTVWGIMRAFQKISATGSASIATVGGPISEALIATAVGLFAAIPAVIFYNFFLSRIRVLNAEMDNFSADFLNIVKRHFFKD